MRRTRSWLLSVVLASSASLAQTPTRSGEGNADSSKYRPAPGEVLRQLSLSNPQRLLDAAVGDDGRVFALVESGFEIVDFELGRAVPYRFDPKSTTPSVSFLGSRNLAVALNPTSQFPIILWCGRTSSDRTLETYVADYSSATSVKLEFAARTVWDMAVSADSGNYLVLGSLMRESVNAVHEFSPDGQWMRSYHPWPGGEDARKLRSHSYLVPGPESLFVIHGLLSDQVFEFRDGLLLRTHALGELPEGWARWLLAAFWKDGRLWVHSRAGRLRSLPGEGSFLIGAENQIHVLDNGEALLVSQGGAVGDRIGMTPEGRFISCLQDRAGFFLSDR